MKSFLPSFSSLPLIYSRRVVVSYKRKYVHELLVNRFRVPTCQGKVREIWFFSKVREKSMNSVKWSGKLENLQKSGKSQGILKSCLVNPSKIKQTNMR